MAIAKMQKFSLLTFYDQKEAVLEQLQDFQGVELLSSEKYYDSEETTGVLTPVREEQSEEEMENQFGQVNWSLNFLEEYVPKKGMLAQLRQPIKNIPFKNWLKQPTPIPGKNYARPFVNKTNVFA